MLFKGNKQRTHADTSVLDEAVGAWHEAEGLLPVGRLSPGARANVRALARQRIAAAPSAN